MTISSKVYAGKAIRGCFWTYRHSYVLGVLTRALFDAPITQITFKNTTLRTEDTLTYGGTDPRDSQLTRGSVGYFEWWFTVPTSGIWQYNEQWIETISGSSVMVTGDIQRLLVDPEPLAWHDVP
jgi:hypothetical protein